MSRFELHVSQTPVLSGCQTPFAQADYVVLGVPFDVTSTYRTGARFAPAAIRDASLNIETYSFRSGEDVETLRIHDAGDLHISNNVGTLMQRLEDVVKDLRDARKIPVIMGGEHTITLGAMRGIGGQDAAVISFDAHLDLRNRYMDLTTSHTTFMRRLNETVHPAKIVEVGTRAVCKEELAYAKRVGIHCYTSQQILDHGVDAGAKAVAKAVEGCEKVYLTIDMDVLDPAFAPAVQNPEPDGISTQALLALLGRLCDRRTVGIDLVEVTPPYDRGNTAVLAARILFETLCAIEKARGA